MRLFLYILLAFTISSCGNTIYIVRHAEKESGIDPTTMKTIKDPPLSLQGQKRALKLKEILGGKGITHIFSTNTAYLKTIFKYISVVFADDLLSFKSFNNAISVGI